MSFVSNPALTFASTPRPIDSAGTDAATLAVQTRLAPADYPDGLGAQLAGADRPGPREISNAVFVQVDESGAHIDKPNAVGASSLLWVWGQFIDHDFVQTRTRSEPAPIVVPDDDPVFAPGTEPLTKIRPRSASVRTTSRFCCVRWRSPM